jgi:hypothetical protein
MTNDATKPAARWCAWCDKAGAPDDTPCPFLDDAALRGVIFAGTQRDCEEAIRQHRPDAVK